MSALQRSSRSRSKTAPETGVPSPGDTEHSTPTLIPTKAPTPEPLESPEPELPTQGGPREADAVAQSASTGHIQPQTTENASGQANGTFLLGTTPIEDIIDPADDGSSSLSEPEESIEDRDEAASRTRMSPDADEDDSEAETERLESTPRKLTRTATDVTIGGEGPVGRSPSKLARVMTMEHNNDPAALTQSAAASELSDNEDDDAELPDLAHDVEADREDSPNGERKRKRSSSALSSIGDEMDIDQPARKRSTSSKHFDLNGDQLAEAGEEAEHAIEDEEEHPSKEADTHVEDEEMADEPHAREAASETPAIGKKTKGKKGQKKGKRTRAIEQDEAIATPAEAEEEEVAEGDLDAEEAGVIEEERDRKHNALEALNKIEKQFLSFQKKRLEEQLEKLSTELVQLKQPDSTHPEYLLMLQAVDKRRDEKIRQENVKLDLAKGIARQQFVAMRGTIVNQWRNDISELRMDYLTKCNQRITQLQRERRYWGQNDADYTIKYNPKRSQQVQQQTAYNLEVSILSGVAKYVGFPAAPDLSSARSSEMDQDFAAMGIPYRSAPAQSHMRFPESSRADRVAEEQFYEQNAWANPQHPAHHHGHYHTVVAPQQQQQQQQRVASNPFSTPAAQRNQVDIHQPNGSASTIDMQSNPPSASHGQQRESYESPVLQLKQALHRSDTQNTEPAHQPDSTPVRPSSHQPHEPIQTEPQPKDVYQKPPTFAQSALMSQLQSAAAPAAADGPTPASIKDEDATEQLQRAAMPQTQRTGVAVGGGGGAGLFR